MDGNVCMSTAFV